MYPAEAMQEYLSAVKLGQKEQRELLSQQKNPFPQVLDEIPGVSTDNIVNIGHVDIPIERIVGTKTAGRITAFSASFYPLLGQETEFAYKWVNLCCAHLSDEGIRDPIIAYEYLGNFYVQEGNKRVSVLRYFGAPKVPGIVYRVMPAYSEEPHIQTYFTFLKFYESAKLYDIQFRQAGDYGKLLSYLGKEPGQPWSEREQKTFRAYFQYFREAFAACKGDKLDLLPEEALLLWLRVYPFRDLGRLSAGALKKAMANLWDNMVSISQDAPVQVETEPETQGKVGILSRLIPTVPEHLRVAFIYQLDPSVSTWAKGHHQGAEHLQQVFHDRVTVRHYFHADSPEETEALLEKAIREGAQVIFTTAPKLSRATLKAAVEHPKVKFLNCSVDAPYSSVRTYYSRIFEGKFITGAIAGAMSENDSIGYIGTYPIFGEPASINAFALGAQLTNPRAKIELRWSCLPGDHVKDFIDSGIRVISNRDVPTPDKKYLSYGSYGTYLVEEDGTLMSLASPCWMWGTFYEHVIRSILNGAWNKETSHAVNYWWGMDSGVIDVELAKGLPAGLTELADILRKGLQNQTIDPFRRRILAQDGTVKNSGDSILSANELLHMDYLCENVVGSIPKFEELLPFARDTVRELGIYRDEIPPETEGAL